MTMKQNKVTVSHTIGESLKKELKLFSKFSYRTESEIIEKALVEYLQSKKAFRELRKAEAEKEQFYADLAEDCDMQNMAIPRSSLCGYASKKGDD